MLQCSLASLRRYTIFILALTSIPHFPATGQQPPAAGIAAKVDDDHAASMKEGLALFKQDVRRILTGRCFQCHGGEKTEAELDLTNREALLRGSASGPVVKPGDAAASSLLSLVRHEQEPVMPANGAKLDDRQIEALARWIDLGAPYDGSLVDKETDPLAWTRKTVDASARDFWSLLPLTHPEPPTIEHPWVRNEIDRFILAAQQQNQLSPHQTADRTTLLRRASLDLMGLPPSPAEAKEFLEDTTPDAWPRLIERLLASQHYGERWGRHWLDVARFAESHGFEQDYDRPHAYHYRDFVIKALNADMPYNQFVQWQLAGDELAPEDPLAWMATGFLGAGVFPTQLTEREFEPARYDELDDMVATMGTSMLGLTIGCARCHDHKYDPIPSADYYRLVATFATTIRSNIPLDLTPEISRQQLARFDEEHQALLERRQAYEAQTIDPAWQRWLDDPASRTLRPMPAKWRVVAFEKLESQGGASFSQQDDGVTVVGGTSPAHDRWQLTAPSTRDTITAIRIEALADERLPQRGPGRANNGNFALSDLRLFVRSSTSTGAQDAEQPVAFAAARATHQQNADSLSVQAAIDSDPNTGWAVDGGGIGKDQSAIFDLATPLTLTGQEQWSLTLQFQTNTHHSLGRFRISVTSDSAPVELGGDSTSHALATAMQQLDAGGRAADLNAEQREALRHWFCQQDAHWRELQAAVEAHERQKPEPQRTTVMVSSEGVPPIPHHADDRGFPHYYPETYYLKRGDVTQKQGVASTGYLQALVRTEDATPRWQSSSESRTQSQWPKTSYRRQALANWIVDTECGAGNLLARVIVNRVWHHHFGRGLVATPNDFGFQGERPTHPELLDWLASDFIAHGWQLKRLHTQIMNSATYQQSSLHRQDQAARDPENRFLWRFSPRRLEAEVIRDAILSVSGQLDPTPFGPGTLDESMRRRSIYFMIKRSTLVPSMQIFDSPEPLVSVGNRPATTVAPQALLFMNSPHVRAAADAFAAERLRNTAQAASEETWNPIISDVYLRMLTRRPTDPEAKAAAAFLQQQQLSYERDNVPDAKRMALTDYIQVMMSLNEFVFMP